MPVYGSDTPVGAGMLWYTNTAPVGYLLCDGSAVSRTTYAALFAVLNTTYGIGDGSTTFNLPDLRQRFPIGKAASGTANSLAGTGGTIDHTHSIPAHYHGMGTGADLNITSSGSGTTGNDSPDHTHNIGIGFTSPSAAWTITGAGTAGYNITGTTTTTGASARHTHSTPNHTHPSGNIAGRVGLVTGGVDGNAAMTSGTQNPPYLVVNYIIKYA